MSITTYQLIHIISGFLLAAFTFVAVATASAGKNKRIMMITGILSLAMLIGGFGLMAKMKYSFDVHKWLFIKIGAWLVLSAAAGLAYRQPKRAGMWGGLCVLSIIAAAYAVSVRPF